MARNSDLAPAFSPARYSLIVVVMVSSCMPCDPSRRPCEEAIASIASEKAPRIRALVVRRPARSTRHNDRVPDAGRLPGQPPVAPPATGTPVPPLAGRPGSDLQPLSRTADPSSRRIHPAPVARLPRARRDPRGSGSQMASPLGTPERFDGRTLPPGLRRAGSTARRSPHVPLPATAPWPSGAPPRSRTRVQPRRPRSPLWSCQTLRVRDVVETLGPPPEAGGPEAAGDVPR